MKTALITGVTGQDGSYLAKLLLGKGYHVFGAYRRAASTNFWRNDELGVSGHPNLKLVDFDLTDLGSCLRLVQGTEPDEIYNLGAQSFVGMSFEQPTATASITGIGALHVLEAIRLSGSKARFYQASTSEMFGKVRTVPQTEDTPFHPRSPYGVAKLYAHWITVNYRESFGMFASSGILFNHESPLRGLEFVTRKITAGLARIKRGKLDTLALGNLDAKRDWGFAGDYVEGMWRMLQADEPDTFVLATNRTESVRDFLYMAGAAAGFDLIFEGSDEREIAVDKTSGKIIAQVDPAFYRPAEVDLLIGDASKAESALGWTPTMTLEQLCQAMVEADLRRVDQGWMF